MCVPTNKDTKYIRWDFILSPGSCPRGETLGHWGCPRGQHFFSNGHVAYQIDGDDEHNKMQVKLLFYGLTGDIGARFKVKYH